MMNKIVIAAGGTGGHIYPAIAVADELKKINERIGILFIGAKGRMEERIVPQNGYNLRTIEISGFKRSLSLKNIKTGINLIKALNESKKILKEFEPDIVFGTGGFVSGPVLRAANKLGIPNVIEEGNSYPGVTVKMLSKTADKVLVNFDESRKYLKRQDNIVTMSYPVRSNLKHYNKKEALQFFGLDENKRTLFVFGGSLGAASINNTLLSCVEKLVENNIQIIWQTGEMSFDEINSKVKNSNSVKVLKYIDNIDKAYSASDLIVCRAGISTVMELASFGCAAIFVPFAGASENHQEKNAKTLVEKDAALMLLDRKLNEKFYDMVTDIIYNEEKLESMKSNIKQFADKEAANKIAKLLIELAGSRKN